MLLLAVAASEDESHSWCTKVEFFGHEMLMMDGIWGPIIGQEHGLGRTMFS